MYGIKNNVAKNKTPKFKMSHLYSVIALKIVNDTDGDIVVKYAELKANEDVVGDFKTNISGDEPSFISETGKTSSIARVQFKNPTKIEKDGSATLYMAIKPFDASNDEIVISINGEASKGNGASRTVKMPANVKFEAGKVTTLMVPVENLSFHYESVNPATSNVMKVKATGLKPGWFNSWSEETKNAVVFNNTTEQTIIVNGKAVQAYIVGSADKTGSVVISGKAKELFPYIPIEFYATSFGDKAVMRVDKISVGFNFKIIITISQIISMTYADLTEGDDPLIADVSKIRFSGLLPLERVTVKENGADNKYAVILDEQPFHKPLSEQKVTDLLANFDLNPKDEDVLTFEGLRDALTNPALIESEGTPANITATNVFNKLHQKLAGNETVADVFDWLMGSNAKDFFTKVGNLPIEVTLTTLTEDGADPRVIVWGLNSPNVK